MKLRPLLRYTAYGWFGLAVLSAAGAAVFLIGAAALAANGPPPSDVPTPGPLGMLLSDTLMGPIEREYVKLVAKADREAKGGE